MKYPDEKITSVSDLLRSLAKRQEKHETIWFRGHAQTQWKLAPSIAREEGRQQSELTYIKRFRQNAPPFVTQQHPQTEWEWLLLMQHHGLPTRLLDWTESPLAGLYFACSYDRDRYGTHNGVLWCLDPLALNAKAGPGLKSPTASDIPCLGIDQALDSYSPGQLALETTSSLSPLAVIAGRNSPRMAAQLGVFTLSHRNPTPLEKLDKGKYVWKYVIPRAAKKQIHKELQTLKITKLTLFPELENVKEAAMGATK